MSLKDILTICLALILVVGIFALPYDFDLSIGNNATSGKNDDVTSDTDNDNSNENGGTNNGENSDLIVTAPHSSPVCPTCLKECTYTSEDYGSIGVYYYNLNCSVCDYSDSNGFSAYHEYSNKDGICTAQACSHECTHEFNSWAIQYVLPYDDRYSMFDASTMTEGDSAVYEGVCTICQKTITD